MGPQTRRPDLKKRTTYLLRMLIGSKKNPDGLSQSAVADEMQKCLDGMGLTVKDCYQTIRNYVKETRAPDRAYAFALGEALRKVTDGVPWMNGYCMLWVAGAYEQALATTFEYAVQNKNALEPGAVHMLWVGALGGIMLPKHQSQFDFDSDVLHHTMHFSDNGNIDESLRTKVAAPSAEALEFDSPTFDVKAYERDLHAHVVGLRDVAIARWLEVVPFMDGLKSAYVAACVETKGDYRPRHASVGDFWGTHGAGDEIAIVALDLARSSSLPPQTLETSLLIVLGQYLNMLDPALHDEGRSLVHLPRWPAT